MPSLIDWRPGPRAKIYISDLMIPQDIFLNSLSFGAIYSELVHVEDYPNYTFESSNFDLNNVFYIDNIAQVISSQEAGIEVDNAGTIAIDTNAPIYKNLDRNQIGQVLASFTVTDPNGQTDNGIVEFKVQGVIEADHAGPRAKTFLSGLTVGVNTVQTGLNFGVIYSELVHTDDYPEYTFTSDNFNIEGVVISIESNFERMTAAEAGLSIDESGNTQTVNQNTSKLQRLSTPYSTFADVELSWVNNSKN
mgnify:CR=1 FL=1